MLMDTDSMEDGSDDTGEDDRKTGHHGEAPAEKKEHRPTDEVSDHRDVQVHEKDGSVPDTYATNRSGRR